MVEEEKGDEPEFKWGKKKGFGGKKKDVQFYESFTYDGEDYTLFDSVYLYSEGEPEPLIGKLIKIWENADKTKKVKILWYFRPCEIRNFMEGIEALDNELFLACGEGLGLANINPLETLVGKCNVVCISKDSRNPQPSDEDLRLAEFVFYRFFDVGQKKILSTIDDKIAGVEVKNIFKNIDSQMPVGIAKHGLVKKEISGDVPASNDVAALSSRKSSQPKIEKADDKCFNTFVRENDDSKPLMGDQIGVGVNRDIKSSELLQGIADDKTMLPTKFKGNGVSKASLVKQKSFVKQLYGSQTAMRKGEGAKKDERRGDVSIEKTISSSKLDSQRGECNIVDGRVGQIKELVEDKFFEKEKFGGSSKGPKEKKKIDMQNRRPITIDDDVKTVAPRSSNDKSKLRRAKDNCDVEGVPSKKLKIEEMSTKPFSDKFDDEFSSDVTRRPDVDRSRWFRIPWEEKMKTAYERGTLVLLENLDPSYTSEEVQDIIWIGFKESCSANMVPKTAISSPHSGQAFVIFKRKEAAELVVKKLDESCFLLSNGCPLVASFGSPCFPDKKQIFYGHHVVDQLRMQREMKEAVSTSHCSQSNNIEYDMAMEWCLLQERADKSWRRLYQQQGEELKKLKAKLKSKI